jgi:hypothetical protein
VPALLPSELPVLGVARHHWIVLFRRPHWFLLLALAVLFAAAVFQPNPMALLFLVVLVAVVVVRVQAWRAEQVILTRRRIIRVRGVPETTSSEASLRLDRVSGVMLVQTVPGKLLNYGSLELDAPGHPDVRVLHRIARPHQFHLAVRHALFGDGDEYDDPVDPPVPPHVVESDTQPLPFFFERRPPGPRLR